MINKKGQAAMEFLMTYGWALLVVLIAIGALASFGVLNPSQFLPEVCTLPAGLMCTDHDVTTTTISIAVQNGMGNDIKNVELDGPCTAADPVDIASGSSDTVTCTDASLTQGDNFDGNAEGLTLNYDVTGGISGHSKLVNLIAKVN